jgi:hypothetical protein
LTHSASYRRIIFHWALALLVVGALSRCAWEEARELGQQASILAQHRLDLPSPIQKPVHDCDHESGCICRGATQVVAVAAPQGHAELADLLPPPIVEFAGSRLTEAAPPAPWLDDDLFEHPPISGRQLRALYASLVI